jgi:hypothetical protein
MTAVTASAVSRPFRGEPVKNREPTIRWLKRTKKWGIDAKAVYQDACFGEAISI